MQYCSSQHRTLLLSPVPSTTGYCFCFGSIPSFFLELFLYWSPVAYWAPSDPGSSPFSILSFCLFILFMGFSRQEYWSGLPFPSPADHILSDLSTMTCPSWVAPRAWLSFIELDKAVVRVIRLASFLWLWSQCVCHLMPSRNTYRLTWVFLTLDVGYLFTAAPAKCSRCFLPCMRVISSQPPLLTLDMGLLLSAASPDLKCWVALLGCRPWLQTWGSSSQLLLCRYSRKEVAVGNHPLLSYRQVHSNVPFSPILLLSPVFSCNGSNPFLKCIAIHICTSSLKKLLSNQCNHGKSVFPASIWNHKARVNLESHIVVKGKDTQLCPTLCNPMDYTVHGILQSGILEWVAFPFSRGIFPTQG